MALTNEAKVCDKKKLQKKKAKVSRVKKLYGVCFLGKKIKTCEYLFLCSYMCMCVYYFFFIFNVTSEKKIIY